jgi:hypothetical protein
MVQVTLKNVRLSYADIWVPRPPQDGKGDPKYGATFILDPKKDKAMVAEIRAAIKKVAAEKWKAKAPNILKVIDGDKQKFCWFEEDRLSADGDIVDGFEDMFYLQSKSPMQPTIIDRDRTELTRKDGRPFSGCYVVAKVDIWAQDNAHGKAIRCQLQGLQFYRDGDNFGGGTRSKVDDFEDLSDLGDDEDDAPKPSKAKARAPVEDDDDDIA